MKDTCCGAKLVIVVVTREFLRSQWCMDELRWTLQQREISEGQLPELLPVLYPGTLVRGYSSAEMQAIKNTKTEQEIMDMLTAETINVDDLDPLSPDLERLIMPHSPPQPQPLEGPQPHEQREPAESRVYLNQRKQDLATLASFCCLRSDAHGRCRPVLNWHLQSTDLCGAFSERSKLASA